MFIYKSKYNGVQTTKKMKLIMNELKKENEKKNEQPNFDGSRRANDQKKMVTMTKTEKKQILFFLIQKLHYNYNESKKKDKDRDFLVKHPPPFDSHHQVYRENTI